MFGINYNGLRKRESYDDLVKYIETDPNKIRYPNRTATFIERSHYMKHLGGEDYIEMEEQQIRASKEKVKEDIVIDTKNIVIETSENKYVRNEVPDTLRCETILPTGKRCSFKKAENNNMCTRHTK